MLTCTNSQHICAYDSCICLAPTKCTYIWHRTVFCAWTYDRPSPIHLIVHLIFYFLLLNLQDYKRNAFMEAELQCSNALQSMERKLRTACHATDANIDNIVKVSIYR